MQVYCREIKTSAKLWCSRQKWATLCVAYTQARAPFELWEYLPSPYSKMSIESLIFIQSRAMKGHFSRYQVYFSGSYAMAHSRYEGYTCSSYSLGFSTLHYKIPPSLLIALRQLFGIPATYKKPFVTEEHIHSLQLRKSIVFTRSCSAATVVWIIHLCVSAVFHFHFIKRFSSLRALPFLS